MIGEIKPDIPVHSSTERFPVADSPLFEFDFPETLPRVEWQARRDCHRTRLRPWAEDRVRRSEQQRKHPVYDFLFEYYSFRPAHLLRWSPGVGVLLEGAQPEELDWPKEFQIRPDGAILATTAFPAHRIEFLDWAIHYLTATQNREPQFGCFGLHEWAMVYREEQIRHQRVPLRLSREGTNRVVEDSVLRCTHFDAYRFFTPAAVPRNRWALARETTSESDQPGCVHANMDLYKWAMKIAPFTTGEVVAATFEVAIAARELDMRASPYDLRIFGFEPIAIETREGREEYVQAQRSIFERAKPVRQRLLAEYSRLRELIASNGIE
jgi:hypothetical protein